MFNHFIQKIKSSRKKIDPRTNGKDAILSADTAFNIEEAYKTSRTNIMFSLPVDEKCKKILMTSASPGEGKTTTCLNTAITFSQTGAKVLVIDADLRKPRVHDYMGAERKNGLSDTLCGFIPLEKAIHKNEKVHIDFIPAGQIPPNPAELLSSDAMINLLDTVSELYDYVFIDTPPVTVVTDAITISKLVTGVIIVVRENYTSHETVSRAIENLNFSNAKVLGFIINDVEEASGSYGNYKFGQKYKYNYSYSNPEDNI